MSTVKKSIALFILGIFLLVKISPVCFSTQLFPTVSRSGSHLTLSKLPSAGAYIYFIRLDRCVINGDALNMIPKIKAFEVLFLLFTLSLVSAAAMIKSKLANYLKDAFYPQGKYLSGCVLRI